MTHSDRLELLGTLVDIVEDWLDSKGIIVENPDKLQDEMAANIYGEDYFTLESGFEETLINYGLLEPEKGCENKCRQAEISE